ncbi:MAG: hemolysin family protein [Acidimicrobiales bacterium]
MFRHRQDERSKEGGPRRGGRTAGGSHRSRGRSASTGEGARRSRAADAQEQFILDALDGLRDVVVREVMTPRVDVVALAIPVTAEAVNRAIRETGRSRFPVYDEHLDDLIGVLFVNDLFRAGWKVNSGQDPGGSSAPSAPDTVAIARRLRQPYLVPESRPVLDLLAEMRQQRRDFAVVVDEHGGVEGVLTVKDLLGALVGDLPDEFDPVDEPEIVRVDGKRWLVDGKMNVDEVRDRLGIAIPDGEYVTVGGYLFAGLGRIPAEGEVLDVDGWELRVAEMDKRRVAKVVARRTDAGGAAS